MIRCDTCPRCKDTYPGELDPDGWPFRICGMSGNIVYTIPRKVKRYSGNGYIYYDVSTCGMFNTVEDVLKTMTEPEIERWRNDENQQTESVQLQGP